MTICRPAFTHRHLTSYKVKSVQVSQTLLFIALCHICCFRYSCVLIRSGIVSVNLESFMFVERWAGQIQLIKDLIGDP